MTSPLILLSNDDGFDSPYLLGLADALERELNAELLVVAARAPGSQDGEGLSLFTVAADAPGLEKRLLKTVDPTRKQARLSFEGVPAVLLGEAGGAAQALEKTLALATVCLANEMVGGAEMLRESALDYAQLRVQFGRGAGGNNGVRSVIGSLGTQDFWRLKFGVGRPPGAMDPADYVLRRFTSAERPEIKRALLREWQVYVENHGVVLPTRDMGYAKEEKRD